MRFQTRGIGFDSLVGQKICPLQEGATIQVCNVLRLCFGDHVKLDLVVISIGGNHYSKVSGLKFNHI